MIVGIVNREHNDVSYRVEMRINGIRNKEIGAVMLKHNEKWEEIVSFSPHRAGDSQKVEFLLYKPGQTEVYQSLHLLWVDVTEKE